MAGCSFGIVQAIWLAGLWAVGQPATQPATAVTITEHDDQDTSRAIELEPARLPDKNVDTNGTSPAEPDLPADLVGQVAAPHADPQWLQRFAEQIPDPLEAIATARRWIAESEQSPKTGEGERETAPKFARFVLERGIERMQTISRPNKVRLSLADALHRALEHNYTIRASSYNPAIATTRVVEAEAAFDATYYMDLHNNKVNQPTASTLVGSNIQEFEIDTGLRKLLPGGMQVQAGYNIKRTSNDFVFQQLNPQWTNAFSVQFNQPLLRGFGLDTSLSQIRLEKINRQQSTYQFKRDVRDTLRSVEAAYWRLVQARRNLVVSARLLANFEQIYNYSWQRRDYDVYRIQLAETKARLEAAKADFVRDVANVRNAEDNLIAQMNDPDVDLADDIEIIPTDLPPFQPVVLDRVAEVQTALNNRAELSEAKLAIQGAKIQVGVAKNQALPKLDVVLNYTVAGLGESQDDAFDVVTKNDFHTYFVGINFELPIGNRARRAAVRRARLQYGQAIAALKARFEEVILDTNVSVREVQVNFDQIAPSLQSAIASEDQIRSIEARAERKDFLTLSNELSAHQSLRQARLSLVAALTDYAIAIIDLERSKGTLLDYNNVQLDLDGPSD